MKKFVLIGAAALLAACCSSEPKTCTGTIADASMNAVTVQNEAGVQTFSTIDADKSEAHGLLLGAPVTVTYTGTFEKENVVVTKVTTDPTYAEVIGRWTMTDPLNPEAEMGIELQVNGLAQSINMATLRYTGWKLQEEPGRITLTCVSEGSGGPIEATQTALLQASAEGVPTLRIEDTEVVYAKRN